MTQILNQSELRALYGQASGRAAKKVLPALEYHAKNFIKHSPFVVLSSIDDKGRMDTSPRGGKKGFIHVLDDNHIVIPDSKGNNRVDSLINISQTGSVGMLLMIPGIDETLRINGTAIVSQDTKYINLFPNETNTPKSCIVVTIEEVFLHCAKALMRSKLWNMEAQTSKDDFPTMGRMLKDQLGGDKPVETREEMKKRYKPDL